MAPAEWDDEKESKDLQAGRAWHEAMEKYYTAHKPKILHRKPSPALRYASLDYLLWEAGYPGCL